MSPETIQIGPLVISKVVFDMMLPLVGVVVGGFVTFFSTRSIENRRWEQQKKDRFQDRYREALEGALEWIPPASLAVTDASLLTASYLKHTITSNEYQKQWPNLLHELAKRDLPMKLHVLVPDTIQRRADAIVEQLRNFNDAAMNAAHDYKSEQEFIDTFKSVMEQGHVAREHLDKLKDDTIAEYRNTFK